MMKIVFITQEDPFYVKLFFEEFFKNYEHKEEILSVYIAPSMNKSFKALLVQMFIFYGPFDFVKVGIKYVFYKFLNKLCKVTNCKSNYSIESVCVNNNIQVSKVDNINDNEFVKSLSLNKIDLIISIASPQIFKKDIINVPVLGCINIHNALLPKYKGMLPNFWQMLHQEETYGSTVHYINEKLDDGDIIFQQKVEPVKNETLDDLVKRTKKNNAHAIIEVIDKFKNQNVTTIPNISSEGSYFSFPGKKDVREFRAKGLRLI